MKISINWLKSVLAVEGSVEEIANKLSVSGLEVEHIEEWESIPGGLKGFVVGEVLTCEKHPDADRLKITTVSIGSGEPLNIVCGAPNVAAGQKVVVATVGTLIQMEGKEPFEIKKSKIRGAESAGMICAEDEMGMGSNHDGILVLPNDAPVGQPAAEYFKIEQDVVLEIGLTANRGDAASHLGVARDVAALFGLQLPSELYWPIDIPRKENNSISVEDAELCHRYIGVCVNGVEVKESPDWLKNRLKSIGLEPKNNVVDATNFVLHHYGQPVHAFDRDRLNGDIHVRKAKNSEKIVTLDGSERPLNNQDLVIADSQGPIAIAGVMGGKESAVSENTRNLFLEIAHFHPGFVRKTAKRHVINTDASFRFERGIDLLAIEKVAETLTALIVEVAGGSAVSMEEYFGLKPAQKTLDFTLVELNRFAGMEYEEDRVKGILRSLGFGVDDTNSIWKISVPSWRNDVEILVDIYEEVMRIYGYDHIPLSGKMQVSMGSFIGMERKKRENVIRDYLVGQGFFEASNNSLVSSDWYEGSTNLVELSNPLSTDMGIMRQSLVPGLLSSVAYNQNRQADVVKLFELGRTYEKTDDGFKENSVLTMVVWGNSDVESWESSSEKTDFFDMKRSVQGLVNRLGSALSMDQIEITPVPNKWLKKAGVNGMVFSVELPLKKLLKPAKKSLRYQEPGKYFSIRRDLSLVVDKSVRFEDLYLVVKQNKLKFLTDVRVFDVFEGKPLDDSKKAVALSFTFNRLDSTMKDEEADSSMAKLMTAFEGMGAVIRR
jgi:phenylalanyl-tRNA synthetase beta chain